MDRKAAFKIEQIVSTTDKEGEAEEILLRLEVLSRIEEQKKSGERFYTLREVVEKLGITREELGDLDDIDISVD